MEIKLEKLVNGSKLAVVVIPEAVSATTIVLVKAGPRYDPQDKTGLSHFVEHMLFRGSRKWPSRCALASALEARGASDYAFSYYETNSYWIRSSVRDISLAIESLLDRILNPILKEEDIKREKGVVRDELEILKSNPEKLIWELWSETVWQNTPLGRFYLGSKEEINSFSKKDIQSFRSNYYIPERIVYVVCGGVDFPDTKDLFNNLLGESESMERMPLGSVDVVSAHAGNRIKVLNQKIENVNVAIGVPTVPFGHRDITTLNLIGAILAGGMSSRLRRKMMDSGLTYSIAYTTEYLSDTGYLVIMFTTDRKKLNKTLQIILDEFENISKNTGSQDELNIARGFLSGTLQVNIETTYDWAKWYADQLLFSPQNVESPEEEVEKILQINPSIVKNTAEKYLNPKNIYLAVVGDIQEKDIKTHIV